MFQMLSSCLLVAHYYISWPMTTCCVSSRTKKRSNGSEFNDPGALKWGEPPFGFFYTITGYGLLHLGLLGGLFHYIDTYEWKILLVWAIPPLLHGLLHRRNPLLWMFISPNCSSGIGMCTGAASTDVNNAHIWGIKLKSLDLYVDALHLVALMTGGLILFLGNITTSHPASYVPIATLLALVIIQPAWQMRILSHRVSYLINITEDLDPRWHGMKVLAQLYSLWMRFRIPLCLAQAAVLISERSFMQKHTCISQYLLVAEILHFSITSAAGYRFHSLCLAALEELALPPVPLKRHCFLFAFLACIDLALKVVELNLTISEKHDEKVETAGALVWITLFGTATLSFYILSLTLVYLTYNRHVLDDVLILVNNMGIYRTVDGQALVPEWMYSQLSHPSTTVLSFHILYFNITALPTVAVLCEHFVFDQDDAHQTILDETLFLDLLIGLLCVLLYFGSFLTESLLGSRAVRCTVMLNLLFTMSATTYRLYTPHELSKNMGEKGKELSYVILYSLVTRNAIFWIVVSLCFYMGLKICSTSLISGSLWTGLNLKKGYLESIEARVAAKAVGESARNLFMPFALLMAWDLVIWIVCTTEDLCYSSSTLTLQLGLICTLISSISLFISVVTIRLWRPLKLGPLYVVEWALVGAFFVALATGTHHISTAYAEITPVVQQIYAVGVLRVLTALWIIYDLSRKSWVQWRRDLEDCTRAYIRVRHQHNPSATTNAINILPVSSNAVDIEAQTPSIEAEHADRVSQNNAVLSSDADHHEQFDELSGCRGSVQPAERVIRKLSPDCRESASSEFLNCVWLRNILPDGMIDWIAGPEMKEVLGDMHRSLSFNHLLSESKNIMTYNVNEVMTVAARLSFEDKCSWFRRQLHTGIETGDEEPPSFRTNQTNLWRQPPSFHSQATNISQQAPPFLSQITNFSQQATPFLSQVIGLQVPNFSSETTNSWQQPWHQLPQRPFPSWPYVSNLQEISRTNESFSPSHSILVEISRSNLLESSVQAFEKLSMEELRLPLRFRFSGESAIDTGGVGREWFQLISEALFSPSLGLFVHAQTDIMTYAINPRTAKYMSSVTNAFKIFKNVESAYRFVGVVLGKAVLEEKSLPVHLSRDLYKHILGLPVSWRDLEYVDPKLAKNLDWLRKHQGVEVLSLNFTFVEEADKARTGRERYEIVELKPNGRDTPVTDVNKQEYIQVATKYIMLDRISPQLAGLLKGFYEVVPSNLLGIFDPHELELLISGLDKIDVKDWRAHTAHLGVLRPNHRLVRWFWEIVEEFDQPMRSRLLQFVTGSSRVPAGGFRELQGMDGEQRLFTLAALSQSTYGPGAYPMAHTCFNRLDLPLYEDCDTLRTMLTDVVHFELMTGFGTQ